MTIAEYAELGGFEGAEVVMWLTMRGALPANVVCKHRSYYLPSMAGIATAIYEGEEGDPKPSIVERHRQRMANELAGIEKLEGTYPFTIEVAVRAYRVNDFLHRMVEPEHRAAFLRDPEASFEAAGLSEQERDLIRRRDWRGLLHYGVIFFMLEKLGAVIGRIEPAHLRRDAWRNARRLSTHPQCARCVVLGCRKSGWKTGLGQCGEAKELISRLSVQMRGSCCSSRSRDAKDTLHDEVRQGRAT